MRPTFHGKTYWYPTPNEGVRELGVLEGLGGTWIVGWIRDTGGRRRVKTKLLPAGPDPAALQVLLDLWAVIRHLDEVIGGALP